MAPYAGTDLSKGALPEEMFQGFSPQYLCPLVGLLCSESVIPGPSTRGLFEAGAGWVAETRWQRSGGVAFPANESLTPEMVMRHWHSITNFDDGRADNPREPADGTAKVMANLQEIKDGNSFNTSNAYLDKIAAEQKRTPPGIDFSWSEKDGHKDFQVLPTYGVIPPFGAKIDIAILVPNFKWTQLLHGEQYLEIRKYPIPTHADTVNYPKLVEVVDKGKAAAITTGCTIKDKISGEDLFYTGPWSSCAEQGKFYVMVLVLARE